jgi:hypothetical protein
MLLVNYNSSKIFLIEEFTLYDVVAYLKFHNIKIPRLGGSRGITVSGVGLANDFLFWLYDNFENDFDKLERHFPFIRTLIYRRKFWNE